MNNKLLSMLALLMAATTGAWAQEPEYIDLTTTDYKTWTLDAMPAYAVGLIVEYETELALADASSNAQKLFEWDECEANVTITDRTLSKLGEWNTLCLPFNVTAAQMAETTHPLYGAIIKELNTSTSSLGSDGTLTLIFTTANSITAGKPYLVKWENASGTVSDPVFNDVEIDATAPTPVEFANNANTGGSCQFVGQYSPFSIGDTDNGDFDGDLNEIILLGSGSQLGYSKNARTLKTFRCHFVVPAKDGNAGARAFMLDFGDGEATGIIAIDADEATPADDAIYTLDGRRIEGMPTVPGVYIVNGKKLIIK